MNTLEINKIVLKKLLNGDVAGFTTTLLRMVMHITDDYEDIYQNACLKVLERLAKGPIVTSFENQQDCMNQFKSYLYTTVYNEAINSKRRSGNFRLYDISKAERIAVSTEDSFGFKAIPGFQNLLSDLQNEVVELYLLGNSNPEIAARLNTSLDNVKNAKSRGFKKMREYERCICEFENTRKMTSDRLDEICHRLDLPKKQVLDFLDVWLKELEGL